MDKKIKADNVKKLYNAIAKKYNENRPLASNDITEFPKVIEIAGNVKGKHILDLGCGIGKHAKVYIEKGAQVTGIDASEEMIKITKNACGNKGNFFVENFEKVEFDKESFDLISASFSIHYSNRLDYLFKHFYLWLKPGGRVIFSIYHPMQYFLKIDGFDFSKSKKYWFYLNSFDVEIYNYYHPIGKYCESFLSNGFQLKSINETTVPKELKGWSKEKKIIPNAMIFEIVKVKK
jgi:ubiquinone/menaquinone biosynthesis C-methylase UbiE